MTMAVVGILGHFRFVFLDVLIYWLDYFMSCHLGTMVLVSILNSKTVYHKYIGQDHSDQGFLQNMDVSFVKGMFNFLFS